MVTLEELIQQAQQAAARAYAPYSHYHVGAVLVAKDGQRFSGCNVENAAYPAGICAERTALVKAVSEGVREFEMIVVWTRNGGSPCGICRQMLFEFAPDLRVLMVNEAGEVVSDLALHELLLHGFSPAKLVE